MGRIGCLEIHMNFLQTSTIKIVSKWNKLQISIQTLYMDENNQIYYLSK